jgi:hypothetical protein
VQGYSNEAGFSVPVDQLLATPGVTPAVAKLIAAADVDNSGSLSLNELVRAFQIGHNMVAEKRLLTK